MMKQKLAALCDDRSLRQIECAVGNWLEVVQARDGRRLLELAQNESVTAVIVDDARADLATIELLTSVRSSRDDIRRILLTDYCNLATIVQGIHSGVVQRIIYKPISATEVTAAVSQPESARFGSRPLPTIT